MFVKMSSNFDLEFKITYDELAPSLQNRILQIELGNSVYMNGSVIGVASSNKVKWIPTEDIGGNIWIGEHQNE